MLKEADLQNIAHQMSSLWNLLTEEDRDKFSKVLSIQVYRKNQMVYHEGESPDNLLCVLSGKVKIFREGKYTQ